MICRLEYDGMTDPLGQSQVIPYLSGLTKYGYKFTILSCDRPEKYAANKDYVLKLIEPYPMKWWGMGPGDRGGSSPVGGDRG